MKAAKEDNSLLIIGSIFLIVIFIVGLYLVMKKKKVFSQIQNLIDSITIWDPVSEAKIMTLHPSIRGKAREFIDKADKEGIKLRVTSGYRSWEEQAKLYAQGRTAPGSIVTNAQPGSSFHNYGTALDVVPMVNGVPVWNYSDWNNIGNIGKSLGFKWGGDFTSIVDKPHFEMNLGNTLAQLKTKYNAGQLTDGYVNLT